MAEKNSWQQKLKSRAIIVLMGGILILNLQMLFLFPGNKEEKPDNVGCIRQVVVNFVNNDLPKGLSYEEHLFQMWQARKGDQQKILGLRRPEKNKLTIGIPVKQWPGGVNSLIVTLSSLINNTTIDEKLEANVAVVLWSGETYNNQLVGAIIKEYHYFIRLGFIEIIQPGSLWKSSVAFLQNSTNFVNEDLRTLQFMTENCRSSFYLHLNDDIMCAPHFYFKINAFMNEITEPWSLLEFSELGYVGKLVPSNYLHKWAVFMTMFSRSSEPLDKTFALFRQTCLQMKRIMLKPTLFQRIGSVEKWESGLETNNVVVKDRFFDDGSALIHGDDPEGVVVSNMVPVGHKSAEFAYRAGPQNFFWARAPREGDWLVIVFEKDIDLSRVVIHTGFDMDTEESNLMDILHNGTVEISPKLLQMDQDTNKVTCADYRKIGVIENGHAQLENRIHYRKTKCLKITVSKSETDNIIFQQISVFLNKN